MSTDILYNRILSFFEAELSAARKRLEAGEFESFKEQVIAGRRITDALELLAPHARRDQRARRLVRSGEALIRELMSVREVIRKKSASPRVRQTLLMSQIMTGKEYLQ